MEFTLLNHTETDIYFCIEWVQKNLRLFAVKVMRSLMWRVSISTSSLLGGVSFSSLVLARLSHLRWSKFLDTLAEIPKGPTTNPTQENPSGS